MFGGERVILTELEHASKHSKAWLEERKREGGEGKKGKSERKIGKRSIRRALEKEFRRNRPTSLEVERINRINLLEGAEQTVKRDRSKYGEDCATAN